MNNIPNSVAMQQQPNASPLPPTRLPMRYPTRHRRRLNVGGVLGGNGFYSNIGGNGFYPNIGANGFYPNIGANGFYPNIRGDGFYSNIGGNDFYPNIRGYGYYPPFQNSNYSYPIIDRPRNYRRNIFDNRNYILQQSYLYYNQPQEAVVMP